jgi:hypothetical protein
MLVTLLGVVMVEDLVELVEDISLEAMLGIQQAEAVAVVDIILSILDMGMYMEVVEVKLAQIHRDLMLRQVETVKVEEAEAEGLIELLI